MSIAATASERRKAKPGLLFYFTTWEDARNEHTEPRSRYQTSEVNHASARTRANWLQRVGAVRGYLVSTEFGATGAHQCIRRTTQ